MTSGMVEAAGSEPIHTHNPNLMMANDFGSYDIKPLSYRAVTCPLESPPVLWGPPRSWRYSGDAAALFPHIFHERFPSLVCSIVKKGM